MGLEGKQPWREWNSIKCLESLSIDVEASSETVLLAGNSEAYRRSLLIACSGMA